MYTKVDICAKLYYYTNEYVGGYEMQNNEFLMINNLIYQIYSIDDFDLMRKTFFKIIKTAYSKHCF